MHPDSISAMTSFKTAICPDPTGKKILDVGSQDINGSYRPIFAGAEYIGLDIVAGNGVDVVCEKTDNFPFEDATFDIVISGQALEHCQRPWLTVKEIGRVIKSGGYVCLIAPWRFYVHKDELCPLDCWRILDDGMKVLLEDAGFELVNIYQYGDDTIGIGIKK